MGAELPWWLVFSASQVSLWRECERKWGFRYLAGFKFPQSPAQALGDAVDSKQLQPYLLEGRPLDVGTPAGDIAVQAVPFLPAPKTPGIACQQRIALTSADERWGYQGYIDLWCPDAGVLPQLPAAPVAGSPAVVDFKTTKSLRWQKTAEILKTDPQAQLYATWAIGETQADYVDLYWLTITTATPYRAKPSHLRVGVDHVAREFDAIERTGLALYEARVAAHGVHGIPDDADQPAKVRYVLATLQPNAHACDSYGGCEHRATCNLAPQTFRDSTIERIKERKSMSNAASALARLKARSAGAAPPTPIAVQGPNGETVITSPALPTAPATMGCSDKDVPAPPSDVVPPAFAGINPPESQLPPPAPVAPSVTVVTDAAPSGEAPKKRGRPPGSKNTPKIEGVAFDTTEIAGAVETALTDAIVLALENIVAKLKAVA